MARIDIDRFAHLSDGERFDQIAALVAKAVVLSCRDSPSNSNDRTDESSMLSATVADVSDLVSDETEKQILRYLERVSSATPLNFRAAMGLSRQTVARKLASLRASGFVVVTGKTRSARYELAGPHGNN